MWSAEGCIKKTRVELRYIPPPNPARPADCKNVKFIGPELMYLPGEARQDQYGRPFEFLGPDMLCGVPTVEGAGGIIFLLQVGVYIQWDVEFTAAAPVPAKGADDFLDKYVRNGQPVNTAPPKQVRETHRVYVSLPMLFKVEGPHLALSRVSPAYAFASRVNLIRGAIHKLYQMNQAFDLVRELQKSFCPADIEKLKTALRTMEALLKDQIHRAAYYASDEDLASILKHSRDGTARFAGDRYA